MSDEFITLTEDSHAVLVPSATPILIPAGTKVRVVQDKGGSITVEVNGNLARIARQEPMITTDKIATGTVNQDEVWQALKQCYDPEIPVNIVDLGLIYDCRIEHHPEPMANHVYISMTLTAPGCGMGPVLVGDVEQKVLAVDNVTAVTVEMVFDPPWSQDRMSDAAKLELGIL